MSEDAKTQLEAIVNTLKDAFAEVVKNALKDAQGDIKEYGALLAKEYAKYLWRAYKEKDEIARENLGDLKAQVALIALKRQIIMTRESLERLRAAVEAAATIGVRVLITAAVAAL